MPAGSDFLSRRGLVFSGSCAALLAPELAHAADQTRPNVLFICRFGTVKSPIARELLRRRAAERRLELTAFSRGMNIEDHVSPGLAQALRADGLDIWRDPYMVLHESDIRTASQIVLFDSLPDAVTPPTLDWSDLPSFNEDYTRARAELDRRLAQLLDALQGQGAG